jgi:hypothetical protein
MALTISPPTSFATPNGRRNFSASGGTPPYVYSISSNRSGGSVDPATGIYLAGPRGLVPDQVTVTDSVASTSTALVTVSAGAIQDFQRTLGPPSLRLPNGMLIETSYGGEKDILFERQRQGALVSMPGLGPPDALDGIAWERQLPRATTESPPDNGGTNDQALAARLQVAWDDAHGWLPAGAFKALLYALDRAGFPMGTSSGANIIQRHNRYAYLTGAGGTPVYSTHGLWSFDGSDPRLWNQFGVLFGGSVSGLTVGSAKAALLNQLVMLWKPAKARFMGTRIEVTGGGPWWDWPIGVQWDAVGRDWGDGISTGLSIFIPPS